MTFPPKRRRRGRVARAIVHTGQKIGKPPKKGLRRRGFFDDSLQLYQSPFEEGIVAFVAFWINFYWDVWKNAFAFEGH